MEKKVLSSLATLFVCSVLGFLYSSGSALATPPSGFTSNTIAGPARFDEIHVVNSGEAKVQIKTKGDVDVVVQSSTFAPGGHTGWHTHPGPILVIVQSGTVTYYDGDDPSCTPHVAPAGEGFTDQGGGHVHIVRNEGTIPAQVVATRILPAGETVTRNDAPAPGNCPF
jgi:Cupin domain